MRRLFFEEKIIGINALLIFAALTLVISLVAYFGGELLNLSNFGFEVIYPFITAIAVGEWGKTRADANFDIIAAQSKSLFKWVTTRFWTPFLTANIFAFVSMTIVFLVRNEMVIWEMAMLYFPPAFFLSTLCALCGICFTEEHIATLIAGSFSRDISPKISLLTGTSRMASRFRFSCASTLFRVSMQSWDCSSSRGRKSRPVPYFPLSGTGMPCNRMNSCGI